MESSHTSTSSDSKTNVVDVYENERRYSVFDDFDSNKLGFGDPEPWDPAPLEAIELPADAQEWKSNWKIVFDDNFGENDDPEGWQYAVTWPRSISTLLCQWHGQCCALPAPDFVRRRCWRRSYLVHNAASKVPTASVSSTESFAVHENGQIRASCATSNSDTDIESPVREEERRAAQLISQRAKNWLQDRKRERMRLAVVNEVIDTEIEYSRWLMIAHQLLFLPWLALYDTQKAEVDRREDEEGILPPSTVFGNIPTLCALHDQIKEALCREKESGCVGKVWASFLPYCKEYCIYVSGYAQRCEALNHSCETHTEAKQVVDEVVKLPDLAGLPVSAVTIKPVQRLPLLRLLLDRLLKLTKPSHPDFRELKDAMQQLEVLLERVNGTSKDSQAMRGVITASADLAGTVPGLVRPHRRLIKRGSLQQAGLFVTWVQPDVELLLFNDMLIIAQSWGSFRVAQGVLQPIAIVRLGTPEDSDRAVQSSAVPEALDPHSVIFQADTRDSKGLSLQIRWREANGNQVSDLILECNSKEEIHDWLMAWNIALSKQPKNA